MRRNDSSCVTCLFCEGMNEYGKWICNYEGPPDFYHEGWDASDSLDSLATEYFTPEEIRFYDWKQIEKWTRERIMRGT